MNNKIAKKVAFTTVSSIISLASFAELPVGDVTWLYAQVSGAKAGSEIVIPRGEYALTKSLQPLVGNIRLRGETGNAADVVLKGNGTFRCLITQVAGSTFSDLTVKNGYAANGGAGIHIESGTVSNCVVESCHSPSGNAGGGGMRLVGSSAYDCILRNNIADVNGGGGLDANGNSVVCRCTFENNISRSEANYLRGGGAIQMSSAGIIRDCTFLSNEATYGGAIHGYPSLVEECHFATNVAKEGAVALLFKNTTPAPETLFKGCTAVTNTAQRGVICTRDVEQYRLDGCSFVSNVVSGLAVASAAYVGAGSFFDKDSILDAHRSILSISNCLFRGHSIAQNSVYAEFFHSGECPKDVFGTTFEGNSVTANSSEILPVDADGLVENCRFIGNRHLGNNLMTVLRVCGDGVRVRNCLFATNEVTQGSGVAIAVAYKSNVSDESLTMTVDNCTFAGNVQKSTNASAYGGMIYLTAGSLVRNCLFYDAHDKSGLNVYKNADMTRVSTAKNFFNCCDANATHKLTTENDCLQLAATPAAVGFAQANPYETYDFALAKNSSCVDAGTDLDWVIPQQTLDVTLARKHYRKIGSRIDIGAWEYRSAPGMLLLFR